MTERKRDCQKTEERTDGRTDEQTEDRQKTDRQTEGQTDDQALVLLFVLVITPKVFLRFSSLHKNQHFYIPIERLGRLLCVENKRKATKV